MTRMIRSTLKPYPVTLSLKDEDFVVLNLLKGKPKGSVAPSISSATADGDSIFIKRVGDNRIYEFKRSDIFR